jgi:hypothetical protein
MSRPLIFAALLLAGLPGCATTDGDGADTTFAKTERGFGEFLHAMGHELTTKIWKP